MKAVPRILVIGGTGVFGSRLARLLRRDEVQVIVASRRFPDAKKLADEIGAEALALDRERDLSTILSMNADVVVDAAGPFQSYGDQPYRLVEFCIANRLHYFDLCDDAAFTSGVVRFDADAKKVGVTIISGASSVPAISAAVVADLSTQMKQIDSIESAILPGNRAPRGWSVIASILSQVGAPLRLWRGGAWKTSRAWDEPESYVLAPGIRRTARLIGAPDLELFPERFKARSVTFRAGMELSALNIALSFYAALRGLGVVRSWRWFVSFSQAIAGATEAFGSDRGGMIVSVVGEEASGWVERRWTLLAEAGEGPFIPATPIRAFIRKLEQLSPGARPAIWDLSLNDIASAMSDLAISSSVSEQTRCTLFERALGASFDLLQQEVRNLHAVRNEAVFIGRGVVERGTHPLAAIVAAIFGFPKDAQNIPVRVTITPTSKGETWIRDFAGRKFKSHLSQRRNTSTAIITERFGAMAFDLPLVVRDNALEFPVLRGRVFGIPMPRLLLPKSEAREFVRDGIFQFDVKLIAPLGIGLIVRYRGHLELQRQY